MRPPIGAIAAVVLAVLAAPAHAKDGRKIFVSVDMEGVGGVVSNEQLGPPGFEYERFRQFMTEETNVAIAAAREAGATEFVVSDSHGNMQNLLVEKLPKDVLVVRSAPRPLMMMQGLDESFDGVIFIGYHASTTNPEGVRAHTMSSATLADVRLNGVSVPEAAFNAAIAGQFGVPVLAISGDDVIVKEARALLGDVEGAVVKWAYGFHSAKTLTPEAARDVIRDRVKAAMARRSSFRRPAGHRASRRGRADAARGGRRGRGRRGRGWLESASASSAARAPGGGPRSLPPRPSWARGWPATASASSTAAAAWASWAPS